MCEHSTSKLITVAKTIRDVIFDDNLFVSAFAPVCNDMNIQSYCQNNTRLDTFHYKLYVIVKEFLDIFKDIYVLTIRTAKKDHCGKVLHPLFCSFVSRIEIEWKKLKKDKAYFDKFEGDEQKFWMTENTLGEVNESLYQEKGMQMVLLVNRKLQHTSNPTTSPYSCHKCLRLFCDYDNIHALDDFNNNEEIALYSMGTLRDTIETDVNIESDQIERILFGDIQDLINTFFQSHLRKIYTQFELRNDMSVKELRVNKYWRYHHLLMLYNTIFLQNVAACLKFSESLFDMNVWKTINCYDQLIKICGSEQNFRTNTSSLGIIYELINKETLMALG